jgi:hypothetical protein
MKWGGRVLVKKWLIWDVCIQLDLLGWPSVSNSMLMSILTWHIKCHAFSNNIGSGTSTPSIVISDLGFNRKMEKVWVQKMHLSKCFRPLPDFCGLNVQVICSWEICMPQISLWFSDVAHEVDRIEPIQERKIM